MVKVSLNPSLSGSINWPNLSLTGSNLDSPFFSNGFGEGIDGAITWAIDPLGQATTSATQGGASANPIDFADLTDGSSNGRGPFFFNGTGVGAGGAITWSIDPEDLALSFARQGEGSTNPFDLADLTDSNPNRQGPFFSGASGGGLDGAIAWAGLPNLFQASGSNGELIDWLDLIATSPIGSDSFFSNGRGQGNEAAIVWSALSDVNTAFDEFGSSGSAFFDLDQLSTINPRLTGPFFSSGGGQGSDAVIAWSTPEDILGTLLSRVELPDNSAIDFENIATFKPDLNSPFFSTGRGDGSDAVIAWTNVDHASNPVVNVAELYAEISQSKFSKISQDLLFISQSEDGGTVDIDSDETPFQFTFSGDGKFVVIDAVAAAGQTNVLLSKLTALGLENGATFGSIVSGFFPVANIDDLETVTELRSARASFSQSSVGSVDNQADISIGSDDVRSSYATDGTGVTIGVLSDSYDDLGAAFVDVLNGDLPAGLTVLQDLNDNGSDEGRAMLQLIHDIAPGSDLMFHTAFAGTASFAQGIIDLANAGADVIVDDVLYFAEPMFQDGPIAQAVNTVTSQGVAYYSSAGNAGNASYQAAFNGNGDNLIYNESSLGEKHFFNLDATQTDHASISLGPGESFLSVMQWDQPHASAGVLGSRSDYDIFLLDSATGDPVAFSNVDNIAGGDPVEVIGHTNNSGFTQSYELYITRFAGPDAKTIKLVSFTDKFLSNSTGPTIYGHANAEGAAAIGAAGFYQTPAYGVSPPVLQPYSSIGVTPILFNTTGNRLSSPIERDKPLFVAPDGVNNTFFGTDVSLDADGFPNFFGTSAAAPNTAAAAALILDALPNASVKTINAILAATTIDMDVTGYDDKTGFGLIQG